MTLHKQKHFADAEWGERTVTGFDKFVKNRCFQKT